MANVGWICSCLEQDLCQLCIPGGGGLVQGSVASGLLHVHVRSLGDEQTHRLDILT